MRQFLFKNNLIHFAILFSFFAFSSCEKKSGSVIDPSQTAPIVMNASSSISIINTDTINIRNERKTEDTLTIRGIISIKAFHPQGKNEISIVKYSIADESSSVVGEGNLNDDGVFPDRIANDSIYSCYAQFEIRRVFVGKLILSIWSENFSCQLSNTALLPLSIFRLNHAPVISNLIAPSTINLATTTSFNIFLKVIDPDGQQDIKSVLRFTPSGKVLPLSPSLSNDSTYEETVTLTPPPAVGTYLFRFRAVDLSSDSSNVLTQTIVIINEAVAN